MTCLRRPLTLAACFALPLLALPPAHSAQAAPQTENVDVHAARTVLVQHYRKVGRFYRRFNALPEQDRANLSLHVLGRILPEDKPLSFAKLHLQTQAGPVPLWRDGSDEMVFPLSDALWQENPPLMATLTQDEHIHFAFQIMVKPEQPDRFSNTQALAWLKQLDHCMKDVVGLVFSFLLPGTQALEVTLAPHSSLKAITAGQTKTLFDNTGDSTASYTLEPKRFSQNTQFQTTHAIKQIMIKVPIDLHADLKRKEG